MSDAKFKYGDEVRIESYGEVEGGFWDGVVGRVFNRYTLYDANSSREPEPDHKTTFYEVVPLQALDRGHSVCQGIPEEFLHKITVEDERRAAAIIEKLNEME